MNRCSVHSFLLQATLSNNLGIPPPSKKCHTKPEHEQITIYDKVAAGSGMAPNRCRHTHRCGAQFFMKIPIL